MKKIAVIGSLNVDYVATMEKAPEAGETVLADSLSLFPGGKGANQAYSAACLGANVCMLGAIGNDSDGLFLKDNLAKASVDVSSLKVSEIEHTGIAMITLEKGENRIVVIPGANSTVSPETIDSWDSTIRSCDIVVLQLEIPLNSVIYAAKKAKEYGKFVILDPAPAAKEDICELLKYADIVKPNRNELVALSNGITDLDEAANYVSEKFGCTVIVTLGKDGCVLFRKGFEILKFKAFDFGKVVDSTGAGDCFSGALAASLARGDNLENAIMFASKASSISVTRKGAQPSMPKLQEM